MKVCDLHVHSTFSDGTYTPRQLLEFAKEKSLSAIALTDHNTIDGVYSFLQAGKDFDIECIAGVEISSEYEGKSLHIVGLFLPEKEFGVIKDFLAIPQKRKQQSNDALAISLNKNGYKVDYEKIKAQAKGQINRVHFANELIANGYVDSVATACQTILSEDGGIYVPPKRLTAFEVIEFLKKVKAVPVLAHPLLDLSREELLVFLPIAKRYGLVAMETNYCTYTEEEIDFSIRVANEFSLLTSGGSDFHGDNKPNIKIGIGEGDLKVPYDYALKMKNTIR